MLLVICTSQQRLAFTVRPECGAFWEDPDMNPPRRIPSQLSRIAQAIHKPQSAISDIVHGRRAISTEMALLLSRALGATPEFWLNLEKTYQLNTFDDASLPQVQAEKVFVSRQTISNWENGKSYPDVQSLSFIAGHFGTSIDEFVKGDLPMIVEKIEEEDARAVEKDVREFRRNTAPSSVLAIVSLVVAGVAFGHGNWLALAMCLIVYAIALYFTFLIEKAKKKYDVQTYREIRAFMDGKPLDKIKAQRVQRPFAAAVMGRVLAGMLVGAAVGLLMVWIVRLS